MRLKGCLGSTAAADMANATSAWAMLMARLLKSADKPRKARCLRVRYAKDHATVEPAVEPTTVETATGWKAL